jgi:two-component system, chemotaxis family, protein-glutamate methylesterase/glutaminase
MKKRLPGGKNQDDRIVVIGGSLGSPEAMQAFLPGLPADFPWPIAMVLHRGVSSDITWTEHLQRFCPFPLSEAEDKEPILPTRLFLAPADYHLLVEDDHFALSTDPRVHYARPSIDVLFESAADSYGSRVIGVVLTGASADGAQGAARIKSRGGYLVVQDPATARARQMPEAAIAAAPVDQVLPVPEIAACLAQLCQTAARLEP